MAGFLDGKEIEITCPQCKRKFKKLIGALRQPGVKCPNCSTSFETSQFKKEMDKTDRALDDFKRSLKDIKININL